MMNRLFGVLYLLAAAWAGVIYLASGNVGGEAFGLFFFALLGLPPIAIVAIVHYVAFGRL